MAILKQRLLREGSSGTFDTIHLETESGLVIMPDGSNLDQIVEALQTAIADKAAASHTHTPSSIGAAATSHTHSQYLTSHQSLAGYVPTSRTINGKALTGNITLSASDVSAAAIDHSHSDMGHPYTGIHMIEPSITTDQTTAVINLGSWVTSCILVYFEYSPYSNDRYYKTLLLPLTLSDNFQYFAKEARCEFSNGIVTFSMINGTNPTKIVNNQTSYTASDNKNISGTIHIIY